MIDKAIMTILKPLIEQGVLGIVIVLLLIDNIILRRKNSALDKDYKEIQEKRVNDFKEVSEKYEDVVNATNTALEKVKYSIGGTYVGKSKELN